MSYVAHRVCRTNGQQYHWLVYYFGSGIGWFWWSTKATSRLCSTSRLVATTLQPSGSTSSDGAHYWLRASKHYVAYLYSMVKVIWNSIQIEMHIEEENLLEFDKPKITL